MTALGRTKRIHFVGIGGIGMSGIAELLVGSGYAVTGSDTRPSAQTDRLATLGVSVAIGHNAANVEGADVVVVSSAIALDNVEIAAARAGHVPVIPRAEMLAELMRLRFGIVIAGAHGKTTTTSMVALMLELAGLEPTAVIGGRLSAFGSNARLGQSALMVAEADESDRSFLKLSPSIAVITNIDHEHMDAYGSFDRLVDAFADFADKVPFYGAVVACVDNPHVRRMLPRLTRRVITYGFDADANVRGEEAITDGSSGRCRVHFDLPGVPDGTGTCTLRLHVPGRHNLQNALAAVAVGLEAGVPIAAIVSSLEQFRGADRRYQTRGSARGVTVIDDYGHHPTEIAAVLQAARDGKPARIVAVFQPHRYTRTRDLMAEFGRALAAADVVVLTEIYAAGEAPIPGITLESLASSVAATRQGDVHVVRALDDVPATIAAIVRPGDLVITLGAGSIGVVGDRILDALAPSGVKA